MLQPATSPPTSISPEEHAALTSSTPSSFVDIPPVLRWADEVEVALSSLAGGWEGWTASSQQRVAGKLYVTEDAVTFIPHQQTPGFVLPFPSLTLHALTPASADGPAHLYCQVDESDVQANGYGNGNGNGNGHGGDADDDEDGEDFTQMREIRIYLVEAELEPLFHALSSCSALHDSLLPSGEPSSFFGFGGDADADGLDMDQGEDGQWEDADEPGADGGRASVQPYRHTQSSLSQFQLEGFITSPADLARQSDVATKEGEEEREVDGVADQMDRFLSLVDWGSVPKPHGWDDGDDRQ